MRIASRFIATLLLAGAASVGAVAALAEDVVDILTAEMAAQGYSKIKIDHTWTGRTRVRGFDPNTVRVVELNRKTGQIFKDKLITINPKSGAGRSPLEGPDFDDVNGGVSN